MTGIGIQKSIRRAISRAAEATTPTVKNMWKARAHTKPPDSELHRDTSVMIRNTSTTA